MQFSCKSHDLQHAVSVVQNVAQSKIANPIIENILLLVERGEVVFIGTNLTQTVRCSMEASVDKDGQIALPAKYAGNLVRELGDDEVKIALKRNRLHIHCGKGKYKIGGIPADEFPPFLPVSKGQKVSFACDELREIIRRTVFCTSTEKARFELDGVKVEGSGQEVIFAATDGRRLSVVRVSRTVDGELAALVPTRTWQELARVLPESGELTATFGEQKVMFEAGDVTVLSSLLGDNFPPYDQILPKEFSKRVILDRQGLEKAVRRACVMAGESMNQVTLSISPQGVVVEGESRALGEARDELEAEYDGEPIKVSYKGDYILDFLRSVASAEKVVIEINDAVTPAGYRECDNEEYRHIIMPMRIPDEEEKGEEAEE